MSPNERREVKVVVDKHFGKGEFRRVLSDEKEARKDQVRSCWRCGKPEAGDVKLRTCSQCNKAGLKVTYCSR